MSALDWTKIYHKYRGLWVALKDDEKTVISSGKNLDEAAKKAEKKGYTQPIFLKIPIKVRNFGTRWAF